jgi:hypothetical protein
VEALKAVKAGHADDVDIAAQILANNIDIAGAGTLKPALVFIIFWGAKSSGVCSGARLGTRLLVI